MHKQLIYTSSKYYSEYTNPTMQLILWRHAEAEDGVADLSRALTPKGLEQAQKMAAWLKPQLPKNIHILTSPALRTLQTVEALNMPYTCLDELAPGCSAERLAGLANWPNNDENVLIIGHQPTLGMLAALCMTGTTQEWSVKKGAVWWISSRIRNNQVHGVLKLAMSPDIL